MIKTRPDSGVKAAGNANNVRSTRRGTAPRARTMPRPVAFSPPFPLAGPLAALASSVLWAGAGIVFRRLRGRVPPLAVNLAKNAIAAALVAVTLAAVAEPGLADGVRDRAVRAARDLGGRRADGLRLVLPPVDHGDRPPARHADRAPRPLPRLRRLAAPAALPVRRGRERPPVGRLPARGPGRRAGGHGRRALDGRAARPGARTAGRARCPARGRVPGGRGAPRPAGDRTRRRPDSRRPPASRVGIGRARARRRRDADAAGVEGLPLGEGHPPAARRDRVLRHVPRDRRSTRSRSRGRPRPGSRRCSTPSRPCG